MANPRLPTEAKSFSRNAIPQKDRQPLVRYEALHDMELLDVRQQIKMRPYVAAFFAFLLIAQSVAIFFLLYWSLKNGQMAQLQLVLSVLIAGTLTQSYKISQLIVNKLFEPIDYADKSERFTTK